MLAKVRTIIHLSKYFIICNHSYWNDVELPFALADGRKYWALRYFYRIINVQSSFAQNKTMKGGLFL